MLHCGGRRYYRSRKSCRRNYSSLRSLVIDFCSSTFVPRLTFDIFDLPSYYHHSLLSLSLLSYHCLTCPSAHSGDQTFFFS